MPMGAAVDRPALQLRVGLGDDADDVVGLDRGEALHPQRREQRRVHQRARDRPRRDDVDRSLDFRVDDEALAGDLGDCLDHGVDVGVDEIERDGIVGRQRGRRGDQRGRKDQQGRKDHEGHERQAGDGAREGGRKAERETAAEREILQAVSPVDRVGRPTRGQASPRGARNLDETAPNRGVGRFSPPMAILTIIACTFAVDPRGPRRARLAGRRFPAVGRRPGPGPGRPRLNPDRLLAASNDRDHLFPESTCPHPPSSPRSRRRPSPAG